MTESEINIAIAQACGFKRELHKGFSSEDQSNFEEWRWVLYGPDSRILNTGIPNYCHDLNIMRDVEGTITDQARQDAYCLCLSKIVNSLVAHYYGDSMNVVAWKAMRATAHQRAEAFLRTKGLWKE